jgi:hypothetical protein
MLRFLLNALLALVAARFLFGLFRWVGGDSATPSADRRGQGDETRGGAGSRERAQGTAPSGVDRSTVIDVAFTEEEPEAPVGSAAPGSATVGSAAPGSATASPGAANAGTGSPDLEAR